MNTQSKKILVIDDEEAVRRSFELALEDTGYAVRTVDRGQKGIDAFKDSPADLVFLDLKMPEMSGVETLRGIRKIDAKVPVYIVTAFHEEFLKDLDSARKDNISFQLLRKPIGNVEILTVAQSILDRPVSL